MLSSERVSLLIVVLFNLPDASITEVLRIGVFLLRFPVVLVLKYWNQHSSDRNSPKSAKSIFPTEALMLRPVGKWVSVSTLP